MSKVNKNATEHEFVTPDEEPAAKNNETKAEKFIRLGEYRMNKAIDADWKIGTSCQQVRL